MSIKHTLFISALTVSAAFTLVATGQFGNNQQSYNHLITPITAQARRRHRHYRVRFRRIRRRHTTKRNHRRRGHSRFVVHFRRITPKHRYRTRRVHHYHIDVEGVDDGWTTNYHYYKSESAKIQHAIDIQTAKDEEAEGINPSQADNNQDQTDSSSASNNNSQDDQQPDQSPENSDNSSDSTDTSDQSSNNPIQNNINEMNSETLADINQDREENGEQPYQESQTLDQLANTRAQQYAQTEDNGDVHIDPNTGNYYDYEDANAMGISSNGLYLSENLCSQSIGAEQMDDGTSYNPKNGSQMADDANDSMMNHDQDCGNGHREALLLGAHYMGVGTAYNPKDQSYYLAEDFAY